MITSDTFISFSSIVLLNFFFKKRIKRSFLVPIPKHLKMPEGKILTDVRMSIQNQIEVVPLFSTSTNFGSMIYRQCHIFV